MNQTIFESLSRDDLEKLKFVLDGNGNVCVRCIIQGTFAVNWGSISGNIDDQSDLSMKFSTKVDAPVSATENSVPRFGSAPNSMKTSPVLLSDNGDFSGVNSVTLDTIPTSPSSVIGTLRWNPDEGCAEIVYPNGVVLQLGRELYRWCKNQTGSTIPDGTPVYASGTLGASGQILISPYIADGSIPHYVYLGITTESILNGSSGNVTTDGQIRGIDTSGFAQSDVLYVSPTVAGTFTKVRPSTPNFIIPTAFVVSVHAVVGAIEVRVPTIHSADECNFDNSGTSLAATNVEAAIKETLARLETQETNNTGNNTGDETASTIITKIGDGSKISSAYLPSYVDDVIEAADFASLPVTGETGKIYVTIDTGYQYRWSGSVYVEIKDSGETAASMGVLVNGTWAATPNDTDLIATAEAGGILKKLSWTNAKAFLKTYFDTLYLGITGTAADSTKVWGITISGTPSVGNIPTATSATSATWQAPAVATTNINGLSAITSLASNDEFIVYSASNSENRKITNSDVEAIISKWFFGSGSDGSLTVSSGTTTLSATADEVFKQYVDLTISGGTLACAGKINHIYVSGTFTMSSGSIHANGYGGAGGVGGSTTAQTWTTGTKGNGIEWATVSGRDFYAWTHSGGAGNNASSAPGTGGAGGNFKANERGRMIRISVGAGGGGAGAANTAGAGWRGGAGGGVIIIIANRVNITGGTISANGVAGGDGSAFGHGGGGGGGGGSIVMLYGTLVSDTATWQCNGGNGWNGRSPGVNYSATGGGGGGGWFWIAGGNGGAVNTSTGNGWNGATPASNSYGTGGTGGTGAVYSVNTYASGGGGGGAPGVYYKAKARIN